jgi:hypothetical protein
MLSIVRKADEAFYGGFDITTDPEDTYDHVVTLVRVVDNLRERYAIFEIEDADGEVDRVRLDADNTSVKFGPAEMHLVGVHVYGISGGRDHLGVRIAIDAPQEYRIVRDDAKRKV